MEDHIRIHGYDLALNHSALVEMDGTGCVTWFRYVTSKKTQAKAPWGTLLDIPGKPKDGDRLQHFVERLSWWNNLFPSVLKERKPTHVAVEDYAIAGKGMVYQIGELGGAARLAVWNSGAALRLHDPVTLKMYISHNGLSTPTDMADAVFRRWPTTKVWEKLPEEARLDLVVAYGLCRICLDEINIRVGKIRVDSLHEKEIQAFNRVTKANPVNLLGREFIRRK